MSVEPQQQLSQAEVEALIMQITQLGHDHLQAAVRDTASSVVSFEPGGSLEQGVKGRGYRGVCVLNPTGTPVRVGLDGGARRSPLVVPACSGLVWPGRYDEVQLAIDQQPAEDVAVVLLRLPVTPRPGVFGYQQPTPADLFAGQIQGTGVLEAATEGKREKEWVFEAPAGQVLRLLGFNMEIQTSATVGLRAPHFGLMTYRPLGYYQGTYWSPEPIKASELWVMNGTFGGGATLQTKWAEKINDDAGNLNGVINIAMPPFILSGEAAAYVQIYGAKSGDELSSIKLAYEVLAG
jgi:hypothetical protein